MPNAELRACYLRMLLQPYDYTRVNMLRVLEKTENVSQALLKELVFRGVQIATESEPVDGARVRMCDRHLDAALSDMTTGARSARRIIGFHVDA